MFNKTSSVEFLKYGEVYSTSTYKGPHSGYNSVMTIQNERLAFFFHADTDVFIQSAEGITTLVVTEDINTNQFEEFVVHRVVKINKGVYFNFLPLGDTSKLELAFMPDTHINTVFCKTEYEHQRILPTVRVNELIAYFYNVRGSHYFFPGEENAHWEFTFVDNGTLTTTVETTSYTINSNQFMIYAPYQFHDQRTDEQATSYLTVIADLSIRDCDRELITSKVFNLDRDSKQLLDSFLPTGEDTTSHDYDKMMNTLERIIINQLSQDKKGPAKVANTPMRLKFESELLNEIILYINENIYSSLNVSDLCDHFAISRSSLQALFRNYVYTAPKEYISNLKLDKSKVLIKESKYTISEIASFLGFSSIHYFSRRFKQRFGINPTDYANKLIK